MHNASARVVTLALLWGLGTSCGNEGPAEAGKDSSVLSPYLAIGDKLAADEVEGLQGLGTAVAEASAAKEGQPGVASIVEGAGRIGAQDIATARAAYETMSGGVIEYLQAHPDEQAGHVIVHCSMTFGGKGGLWVQKEGKVMNPYEGKRMLHCGDKLGWKEPLPTKSRGTPP